VLWAVWITLAHTGMTQEACFGGCGNDAEKLGTVGEIEEVDEISVLLFAQPCA
jgi:hypothetical protein